MEREEGERVLTWFRVGEVSEVHKVEGMMSGHRLSGVPTDAVLPRRGHVHHDASSPSFVLRGGKVALTVVFLSTWKALSKTSNFVVHPATSGPAF